jgi:hypothetical protein
MRNRIVVAVAAALAAAPAAAQRVEGRLVDAAGAPVTAAFVSLRDAQGRPVDRALTREGGVFALQAPAAGTYRVRAERIGFAATVSDALALAAGETRPLRLVATGEGVTLAPVVARGRSRCEALPQAGRAAAQLWEEARKAIEATTWTGGSLRFAFTNYERDLDSTATRVRAEESRADAAQGRGVWRSRPAEELSRLGYREVREDGVYFYAPDAQTLLSDAFVDTHCFDVRPGQGGTVGLAFRPVRGVRRTDVEGVLWIDRATSELRHLEFRFTGLPEAENHDAVGGRVEFVRLPGGAWTVRRWWLRMPLLIVRPWRTGMARGETVQLAGIRERGGYVREVTDAEGERVFTAHAGTLQGRVVDAGTDAPLAGARVSLVGTPHAVTTDAEGRFRFDGLDERRYAVTFAHPRTDSLRYLVPATEVAVRLGEAASVRLLAPTEARAIAGACDSISAGAGVLAGTVRNEESGGPLPGARVAVSWAGASAGRGEVESDPEGRFRFCGAPVGVPLLARASFQGKSGRPVAVTLPGADPVLRDLGAPVVSASVSLGRVRLEATGAVSAAVRVTVVDAASGLPVPGVRVTFGDGGEARTTDRRGAFTARGVPHGDHRVLLQHPDYGVHTRWVAISGVEADVDFRIARP